MQSAAAGFLIITIPMCRIRSFWSLLVGPETVLHQIFPPLCHYMRTTSTSNAMR